MGDARVYLFENAKLKLGSVFNIGDLYLRLFSWFEVMGYDFSEKGYEKHDMGPAHNLKIFWEASKDDGYAKQVIEIGFFFMGVGDAEIERDGRKLKTNKSTMEIRFSAYLQKDFEGKMEKSVGKIGRGIYEKYIARDRMDDYETQLYQDVHLFLDEIKSFTSMYQFT